MKKLGNKIHKIISINGEEFSLVLKFADGVKGRVDLSDLFKKPTGLELCPDSLKLRMDKWKNSTAA